MKPAYLCTRLAFCMVTFLLSITITFVILHLMPGDYITNYLLALGNSVPKDVVEAFQIQYGLDKPLWEQYIIYIGNILHGNWGYSYQYCVPVFPLIMRKLGWTCVLIIPSILIGLIGGIAIGAYSGWRTGSKTDMALFNGMIFVRAVPSYWWAIMALLIFGAYLQLFPLGGYSDITVLTTGLTISGVLYHAALPVIVLSVLFITGNYYLMRNSMVSVVGEDYITTARAKGLDDGSVLKHHAMRNAVIPLVTAATIQCAMLTSGSIFIETVFSWPGLGLLTSEALQARDLPLLQGIFLVDTLLIIGANLAADIIYPVLDPRVTVGWEGSG